MTVQDDYILKWSEKLSIPVELITKDFQKLVESEKVMHPDLSDVDKENRALQRLALMFKKQLRSPAIGFEGIVIAVSDVVDTVAKRKREANEFFKTNPQKAIEMGFCDINGLPLETKKEWADGRQNFNFGKPLPEHSYLRNVWGIGLKSTVKGDKPKFFSMSLSGEVAKKEDIALFTPVRFRAIDRTAPEDIDKKYTLNGSLFSKFDVDESIKLPPAKELLNTYCKDMFVGLSNLQEYHNRMKEDFSRLVIVEGDVSTLVLEPTSVGSRRVILEDASNIDIESKGVVCWVPGRINIDFAEQSKILVIGRTGQGKKLDADRKPTEEAGDMMVNVYGLYALPEYKILPNVKPLTEEDIVEDETVEKTDW